VSEQVRNRSPKQRPMTKIEKRAAAKAAKRQAWLAAQKKHRQQRVAALTSGAVVLVLLVAAAVLLWNTSGGEDESPAADAPASAQSWVPLPEGADPALAVRPAPTGGEGKLDDLKVTTLITGTGAEVAAGDHIVVNYVGVTYAGGEEFDASWNGSEPFDFTVGAGQVIEGWDKGLVGATVGSRVQLDIPYAMAYESSGGGIPGDLRFVVDVLDAQPAS